MTAGALPSGMLEARARPVYPVLARRAGPVVGMTAWKSAVARAFDGAAAYDGSARVQALVARALAEAVAARKPAAASVLEIGCGTGLLTAALLPRLAHESWLATDIAPAMIGRCRARLGAVPGLCHAVMDGERPALAPGFDLVVSSLAAQWFLDQPAAFRGLAGLLRPDGLLAVATLVEGTFAEWRAAHEALGLPCATPRFPPAEALAGLAIEGCTTDLTLERVGERHADGTAFLQALRAIGAQTGRSAPLSPGALRRVLRRFEAQGASVTYAVATLLVRRAG